MHLVKKDDLFGFSLWPIIAVCIIGFILAGCDLTQSPVKKVNGSIRLGMALQPTGGLLFIAAKKGFFKEEGLDVKIKTYPSGKRALKEGLLKGEVDIINTSEVPVAIMSFSQDGLTVIGAAGSADSIHKVVARRDAGITQAADLNGKRIATEKGSAVHFYWHLFRLINGIEGYEMEFMKAENLPPAIADKKIDAFSMREPFIGTAKGLLGDNAIVFDERGVYVTAEPLVAMRDYVDSHQQIIQHFLRALIRAEEYWQQYPEESFDIVTTTLGADPAEMKAIWDRLSLEVSFSHSLLLNLEEIVKWSKDQGIVVSDKTPSMLDLMEPQMLEEIATERVGIIR